MNTKKEYIKETGRKDSRHKRIQTLLLAISVLAVSALPAYAADIVTTKLDSLYSLVLGIITAAGVIVLAWGIFEFASAYQSRDTSQQTESLKKVVSGILMVAAPTIIGLLK